VGHLDTGVDAAHPVLRGAIGAFEAFDWSGNPIHPRTMQDTDEHGTHTAGTIAGRPAGNACVGVAPGALLATATVIEGGDSVVRVLAGMDWAIGQGIRVLSMSLGFPGYVASFLMLTQILRYDRGILPVFSVGNEGPGTSRSPGNYSEALSVGAADSTGRVAYFSSSQRFNRPADPLVPDVLAPGVDVMSARPGGGFQTLSGTSVATPHVSGLVALLLEAKPAATVDEIEAAIVASAAALRPDSAGRAARGLVDAPAALEALTGVRAGRRSNPRRR
jgi:subtilisin family serine protease